eukprot:1323747-Pleurochrysis_carterae.AAC.1
MDDELGKVIFIAKSGTPGFLYVLICPDVGMGHRPEGGLRAMDRFDAAMLAVKAEEKLNKGKQVLVEAPGSAVPAVKKLGDDLEPEEDAVMSLGDASGPP